MSNNETEKQSFAVTTAKSEKAGPGEWNNVQIYNSADDALTVLSEQQAGQKSGSCFFPGLLTDETRKTSNIDSIGILIIDIDSGHTQNTLSATCLHLGYKCAIISTFSHMKVLTITSLSAYEKTGISPSEYLIQKMHFLPEIVKGATENSRDDKFVTLNHNPCPHFRILFPLAVPWKRADYKTEGEAKIAWAQWVEKVIYHLGLDGIDKCTRDLNRIFYFARYPASGPQPFNQFIGGLLLDPRKLQDPPHAPKEQLKQITEETPRNAGRPTGSVSGTIGLYNKLVPIDDVLANNSYTRYKNGRYLAPSSATGFPGVVLLDASCFSHHSNDPLADGYAHDAFDCLRILECGGDVKTAYEKAKTIIPDKTLEFLNSKYALTTIGSKTVVLVLENRSHLEFLTTAAFRELYCNWFIDVSNNNRPNYVPLGAFWMKSPKRREYKGVYFHPTKIKPDYHNLYTGLSVEPAEKAHPEAWNLYRRHVEEIVCSGDTKLIRYVWAWLADIVQNMGRKPGVALALRGGRGTGKGAFVKPLQIIFGCHAIQINNRSQVTGRFNGHFENKIIVFIDEGYWSGDKTGEGILKGLITESVLSVERKGIDVIQLGNFSRFIIASNENWIVPAGNDERRFCVIDVSNAKAQDSTYFTPLFNQMESDSFAPALLRFLLDYDLNEVNIRQAPTTSALIDQKIASMDTVTAFWHIFLQGGLEYTVTFQGSGKTWETHPGPIQNDQLYNSYTGYCRDTKKYPVNDGQFFKQLFGKHGLCPGAKKNRGKLVNGPRVRGYIIPTLPECRRDFEKFIKAEDRINWQ